jgi:hypothetical protein
MRFTTERPIEGHPDHVARDIKAQPSARLLCEEHDNLSFGRDVLLEPGRVVAPVPHDMLIPVPAALEINNQGC